MGYWQKYDFYGLLHGCGAAVPAAQLHGLSRDACLQRCSSQWDCHAIAYHQAQAVCRVYMQCDDGELGSRPCAEEWCGYMRATALKTAALNHVETKAGMAGQSRPGWPAQPERLIARGWPKPKAWSCAEKSLRGASWPKAEPACSQPVNIGAQARQEPWHSQARVARPAASRATGALRGQREHERDAGALSPRRVHLVLRCGPAAALQDARPLQAGSAAVEGARAKCPARLQSPRP